MLLLLSISCYCYCKILSTVIIAKIASKSSSCTKYFIIELIYCQNFPEELPRESFQYHGRTFKRHIICVASKSLHVVWSVADQDMCVPWSWHSEKKEKKCMRGTMSRLGEDYWVGVWQPVWAWLAGYKWVIWSNSLSILGQCHLNIFQWWY